ncbi:MAG: fumarylacetoacetate hydrolase family protein [Bacteroidetes bacterium]|nr:fumarylacetoacetate hydrolase family protein [Bacteroidota bacterium]
MKLVTYSSNGKEKLAFCLNDQLFDTQTAHAELAGTLADALKDWDSFSSLAKQVEASIKSGALAVPSTISLNEATVLAPLPRPASCRDGYAFRQHVAAARRNRKVEMIPEFDEYPIFYFTNHNAVQGPGEIPVMPDHLQKLDFELEAAIITCKSGRNIKAEEADEYIAGYLIMNDMSARLLQMEEMKLNLGPAKGKDFCTVIGPMLVTPDELEAYRIAPKQGHVGATYSLKMRCWVNDVLVSEGNMGDMDWTFAEILERCAYGANIQPGEVIGSGTVGTGCFLELNGTGLLNDPNYKVQWLQVGDVVKMEIDGLGTLVNTIVAEASDWSILAQKKQAQ